MVIWLACSMRHSRPAPRAAAGRFTKHWAMVLAMPITEEMVPFGIWPTQSGGSARKPGGTSGLSELQVLVIRLPMWLLIMFCWTTLRSLQPGSCSRAWPLAAPAHWQRKTLAKLLAAAQPYSHRVGVEVPVHTRLPSSARAGAAAPDSPTHIKAEI